MNKIKRVFTIFLLFFFIYLLFRYNYTLENTINEAFDLWLHKIFPSLFFMFVLSDIIINLNLLENISKYFNYFFNYIFNTTKQSGEIFLLSIICGTPTSSYIILKMYEKNKITLNDANKLMMFTFFSNPLFLYNILSLLFNKFIFIKIIIIHYFSNIIIGLLYRNKKENEYNSNLEKNIVNTNFFQVLPSSIKNSINTLLIILGTISFYMIITNLLLHELTLNSFTTAILKAILEITQFLAYLPHLNNISIIKEILAISFISFGGLSIHTQVLTMLSNSKVKYHYFFVGRILHFLIASIIYIIIFIIM